jgi:apolipoprotein N-acyltransferase
MRPVVWSHHRRRGHQHCHISGAGGSDQRAGEKQNGRAGAGADVVFVLGVSPFVVVFNVVGAGIRVGIGMFIVLVGVVAVLAFIMLASSCWCSSCWRRAGIHQVGVTSCWCSSYWCRVVCVASLCWHLLAGSQSNGMLLLLVCTPRRRGWVMVPLVALLFVVSSSGS